MKHLLSDSPLVPAPPKACILINQNVIFKKKKKKNHFLASEEDALQKELKVALLGWRKVQWLPASTTTETNQLL